MILLDFLPARLHH